MSRWLTSANIRMIRAQEREFYGLAGFRGKFATPAQAASRGRDVACIEGGPSASFLKKEAIHDCARSGISRRRQDLDDA